MPAGAIESLSLPLCRGFENQRGFAADHSQEELRKSQRPGAPCCVPNPERSARSSRRGHHKTAPSDSSTLECWLTTWVSATRATWSHRVVRCKPNHAGHEG